MNKTGVDIRYSLITFKDQNEDLEVNQNWTKNASEVMEAVDALEAESSQDLPEDNFDAIEKALDLGFRSGARRAIVDITDAPAHYEGDGDGYTNYTLEEVKNDLLRNGVEYYAISPNFSSENLVDYRLRNEVIQYREFFWWSDHGKREMVDKKVLAETVNGSSEEMDGVWMDIHDHDMSQILNDVYSGIINDSEAFNQVWFTQKFYNKSLGEIRGNGSLYEIVPYMEGGFVQSFNSNSLELGHEIFSKRDKNYASTMVWCETNNGEISNPIVFYINASPRRHDGIISINEKTTGEVDSFWKIIDVSVGDEVYLEINKSGPGNQLHVLGATINNHHVFVNQGETNRKTDDLAIEKIRENSSTITYKIRIKDNALGGYSVHWGSNPHKWSDPVYLSTGDIKDPARTYSYLESLVYGDYSKKEFKELLVGILPNNIKYNFYVTNKNGEIAKNGNGEELIIKNGEPNQNAVSKQKMVLAKGKKGKQMYNARIVLWYT